MVARGELAGVSAGYRVDQWEITNSDGGVVDPDKDRLRWDDDLTFTATRWALYECSLVGVPADTSAMIRSLGGGYDPVIAEIKARIACRVRAYTRQRMHERMTRRDDA